MTTPDITRKLRTDHVYGPIKIAGEDFPGFGTDEEKVARLERAMVAIYNAIDALAGEIGQLRHEIHNKG